MCLMVSGLLRMFEKFTGQAGWNNPDLYWNSLLNLVDWFANVVLPVYAGMHVAVGAMKFAGLFEHQVHQQFNHARHFVGANIVPPGLRTTPVGGVLRVERSCRREIRNLQCTWLCRGRASTFQQW